MNCCRRMLAALLMLVNVQASAIVAPETSSLPTPTWLARIYLYDKTTGFEALYCMGVLVDQRFVLSSANCAWDPFKVAENYPGLRRAYRIRLGTNNTRLEVAESFTSSDRNYTLHRLAEPASVTPATMSNATEQQLLGKEVRILGMDSSLPVKDAFYNPATGVEAYCSLDNVSKWFETGKLCYIYTLPLRSSSLLQARAQVIDPKAADAPSTALDTAAKSRIGAGRLSLDFRGSSSHLCHEDMGLPVVTVATDGQTELVGLVVSTGMALFPVCNGSLANVTMSINSARSFLENIIAEGNYKYLCPAKPVLTVRYPQTNQAELSWPAVSNADGYKLLYTERLGYEPIKTLDVRGLTKVTTPLDASKDYTVALMAYNSNCTSEMTRPVTVNSILK